MVVKSEVLLQKISKGKEQKQSNDVPIDWEHQFANAHVKSSPGDNMETSITKLQGQHSPMQLESFRYRAPHSICGSRTSSISH
jgi:hypothetical protein